VTETGRATDISPLLNRGEVFYSLKSRKPSDREDLLARVALLRSRPGSDRVQAFALITLSSFCVRDCVYCGFRSDSPLENMYRLTRSEIMAAADRAAAQGFRRLILRSGCDPSITPEAVTEIIRDLAAAHGFEIGLSLGERPAEALDAWRRAGASWYWLFRDTSDPSLYRRVRPSMRWADRARAWDELKKSGLRIGTGMLLGMPNQSHESLMDDLLLYADPAIGAACIEPYLPPPDSPGYQLLSRPENLIVSAELPVMEKTVAILRLLRPDVIIALGASHARAYRALENPALFAAGANALIFDFTPTDYLSLRVFAPFLGAPADQDRATREAAAMLATAGLRLSHKD